MKYSPKLMASGLLEHARKAGSFYRICDEISVRFPKAMLDFEEPYSILVKVGKKVTGVISPENAPQPYSVNWKFVSSGSRSEDITPSKTSESSDFA